MALISDRSAKAKDAGSGAYARLLGDEKLGQLISWIHAASIAAGNELEAVVSKHANCMTEEQIDVLFHGTLPGGPYLITKQVLRKKVTPFIGLSKAIEPDFVLVIVLDHKCYVIELKDGDNFDTKKASGEVEHLKIYKDALATKLSFGWLAEIRVCCFNQDDPKRIVAGFKGRITLKEAMTGREFCRLLGISYEAILAERREDQVKNREFVVERLHEILAA